MWSPSVSVCVSACLCSCAPVRRLIEYRVLSTKYYITHRGCSLSSLASNPLLLFFGPRFGVENVGSRIKRRRKKKEDKEKINKKGWLIIRLPPSSFPFPSIDWPHWFGTPESEVRSQKVHSSSSLIAHRRLSAAAYIYLSLYLPSGEIDISRLILIFHT